MAVDARKQRIATLEKQLVRLIHAEHPEIAPTEIEARVADILSKVAFAVVAKDDPEAAIQASRMPPLTVATAEQVRTVIAELWALVDEESAAERGRMTNHAADRDLKELQKRIKQLNDKASQMLLFLSFAIVGGATVNAAALPANPALVRSAMQWWVWAVAPVLIGVLPLRELRWNNKRWYWWVRAIKVAVMWVAVGLSAKGAWQFWHALLDP
jgi:hypothetical protein